MSEIDSGAPAPELDQQNSPAADPSTSPADDAASPDPETPEVDPLEAEIEKRAKGMAQKRIKELTAEARKADREAQEWRTQAIQSAHVVQQLHHAQQTPAPETPKQADFQTFEEYNAAIAGHEAKKVVDQRLAEHSAHQRQQEQQRAEAQQLQALQQRIAANIQSVQGEYPDVDWDEAMNSVPMTPSMAIAIGGMQEGGRLFATLAQNPQIAARIARMPAPLQLAEMGRLAASVSSTGKQVSSAPPPGKPSGSRSAPSTGYRENFTAAEHDAWVKRMYPNLIKR